MKPESTTTSEVVEPASSTPEVWIGTADDYAGTREYGGWIDAGRPVRDVMRDIGQIIDRTPDAMARRWSVHAVRNFGIWQPSDRDGLRDVITVAQGIRLYGPPYSGLVAAVGPDSPAARFERFAQSYLGAWSSVADFAEQVVSECGWRESLASLPKTLQDFVSIDMKKLVREIRRDLTVVDHPDGIWVYDPRLW